MADQMTPPAPREGRAYRVEAYIDIDDAVSPEEAARQAIAQLRDATCQQVVIVIRSGELHRLGVPVRVSAAG